MNQIVNPKTQNSEEKQKTKKIPQVEMNLRFSKDKKYFIITRSETTIYPTNYISKMIENSHLENTEEEPAF